jgi:1,4-dihydroxy-2-naphthoate octaprenyltransferase
MKTVKVWVRAAHIQFYTAVLVPAVLGAGVARYHVGVFSLPLLLVTILGLCLAHAGTNMANDYYDYTSGNDVINRNYSPFNGGTRVIVEGLLPPGQVLRAAVLCYVLAVAVGGYLAYLRGPRVLVFVVVGLFCGFFYSADPVRLANHGVGELFVGLNFGPMVVLGSYYVQTQRVDWLPLLASLPVGLLIAAVLYINEYPDLEADSAVGKYNLVVRQGLQRALPGYYALMGAPYVIVLTSVVLGLMPGSVLLCLLTLPLAAVAVTVARCHYAEPRRLLPANALTVGTHLLTGLLLGTGFFWGR